MPAGSEPSIVTEAKERPGKCLASGRTEGPFIDVGTRSMERAPYNYISVAWFEDQATKLLGMVPKAVVAEEFAKLEEELAEKTERLKALEHLEAKADEIMAAAEVLGELMAEKVPA